MQPHVHNTAGQPPGQLPIPGLVAACKTAPGIAGVSNHFPQIKAKVPFGIGMLACQHAGHITRTETAQRCWQQMSAPA